MPDFLLVRTFSLLPSPLTGGTGIISYGVMSGGGQTPVIVGELMFFTVSEFGGDWNTLVVTDNGGGPVGYPDSNPADSPWLPLVSALPIGANGGTATFVKVCTAADVVAANTGVGFKITLQWTSPGQDPNSGSFWTLLDGFQGNNGGLPAPFKGVPTIDPNWAPNSVTTQQTASGSTAPGGATGGTKGLSPIARGSSHQASELIYMVGTQTRGNGGLLTPPFTSTSPAFASPAIAGRASAQNLNSAWVNSTEVFTTADTIYEAWSIHGNGQGLAFVVAFYDPGLPTLTAAPASIVSGVGTPTVVVALPEVGTFQLAGSFVTDGGEDGALVSAYNLSRFTDAPTQDTPLPVGGGDQIGDPTTTGAAYGAPGAWTLNVPVVADYWVAIQWGGHIYWRLYPAGMVSGRIVNDIVLTNETSDIGGAALGSESIGDPTQKKGVAPGHYHDIGKAFKAMGDLLIGSGDGVGALLRPGPLGQVLTTIAASPGIGYQPPGSVVGLIPISSPSGAPVYLTEDLAGPAEYLVDGGTGTPSSATTFDIVLPEITGPFSPPPGYYAFRRIDFAPQNGLGTPENFVRFLPSNGQTIDGAPQWGCIHGGDVCVLVPDYNSGSWRVHYQPTTLGYLYANVKEMFSYGYHGSPSSTGFLTMQASPGPYGNTVSPGQAQLVQVFGSGSNWQAILQVGDNSTGAFQFTSQDITPPGNPSVSTTVRGHAGMIGSALIAATGKLWHPHNLPSAWMTGSGYPTPRDLQPNEALVYINSGQVLSGVGQVTFDGRAAFIDSQYPTAGTTFDSTGMPSSPASGSGSSYAGAKQTFGDARSSFLQMVVPPSGVFEIEMAADWQNTQALSIAPSKVYWEAVASFDFYIDNSGSSPVEVPCTPSLQDILSIEGSQNGIIPPGAGPYLRYSTRYVAQGLGAGLDGMKGQVPIPAGRPIKLYWIAAAASIATGGGFGDGTGWAIENVPYGMVARALPSSGQVFGNIFS